MICLRGESVERRAPVSAAALSTTKPVAMADDAAGDHDGANEQPEAQTKSFVLLTGWRRLSTFSLL